MSRSENILCTAIPNSSHSKMNCKGYTDDISHLCGSDITMLGSAVLHSLPNTVTYNNVSEFLEMNEYNAYQSNIRCDVCIRGSDGKFGLKINYIYSR